jgi:cell division protein FtsA
VDKLYVGVPADFSFCKTVTLTQTFGQRIKVSELDVSAIYQKANQMENNESYVLISCSAINFALDDGRVVLNPVGQKTTKLTAVVSLIYAEKSFIEKINGILKEIGIQSVEYLSTPLCQGLYLLPQERRMESVVLIDCGYIETSVSIVKGDGLVSLKSFAVGGGHVSADLMECLHITFDEAESLRKQLVLSVMATDNDDYEMNRDGRVVPVSMKQANEIASDRITMIGKLIKKCLSQEELASHMPFYLTGGGISYIKGAKDILSDSLNEGITILYPKDVNLSKPHYSSLLGLLNKALSGEKVNKNIFTNILDKILRR